jgi:hypothetical protein
MSRKISEIAREIKENWQNPWYGAVPYLNSMLEIEKISGMYYQDRG